MLSSRRAANVGATVRFAVLAIALLAAACLSPASAAGKRVALVIGNSAYKTVSPLPNPASDADAIAKSLTRIGFSVTHLTDLGGSDMRRALQEFEDAAAGAEIAIVYYAGHGIELNGENYLIPVDAALLRDSHVEDETVPLSRVMRAIEGASALNLVILDACRDNPFAATDAAKLRPALDRTRAGARRAVREDARRLRRQGRHDGRGRRRGAQPVRRGAAQPHRDARAGSDLPFPCRCTTRCYEATARQQEPFLYGSLGATPIYLVPPGETPVAETPPAESGGRRHLPSAARSADGGRLPRGAPDEHGRGLPRLPGKASEFDARRRRSTDCSPRWSRTRSGPRLRMRTRSPPISATSPPSRAAPYADEAKTRMRHLFEERRQLASRTTESRPRPPTSCGHPHGDYRVIGIAADDVLWVRERAAPRCERGRQHAARRKRHRHRPVRRRRRLQLPMVRGQLPLRQRLGLRAATWMTGSGGRKRRGRNLSRVRHRRRRRAQHARRAREPATRSSPRSRRTAAASPSRTARAAGSSNKWCAIAWQGMNGWASACCLAGEQSGLRPD